MAVTRKILLFLAMTAALIALGRLAAKLFPYHSDAEKTARSLQSQPVNDSINSLPNVIADTSGGNWRPKLFTPLLQAYHLPDKNLKEKKGFWEIVFPKGKPIHEYALQIEKICHDNGINVVTGVELHPTDQSVEYHLEHDGQLIKLRASLGQAFMAGSAKLAIVFANLDSIPAAQLAALTQANWEKTLIVDPYSPNPAMRNLHATDPRNEIVVQLPMEPAAYPFVDPGKHALFIHYSKEEVFRILSEAMDSLPKAVGFASKYGDRAIENQPLLEKLFQFTGTRHLLFLDLTDSPRSLAQQTADVDPPVTKGAAALKNSMAGRCRSAPIFKDSVNIEEELAKKTAAAAKAGEAVLILSYSKSGWEKLQRILQANTVRFNEMGLELVTLSSLSHAGDEAAMGSK